MKITEKEKNKLSQLALDKIMVICAVHGIDYLTLDKKMQHVMLEIFLEGVAFLDGVVNPKN